MAEASDGINYGDLIISALQRGGDRPAFVAPDETTLTYRQSADLFARMRRVLRDHGVVRGTGVGVFGPNRPEIWLATAAVFTEGARFTALNPLNSVSDIVYMADNAELEVLVVDPMFVDRAEAIAAESPRLRHVFTLGPSTYGIDILQLSTQVTEPVLSPCEANVEDIAWLQYTGGTTGVPKGVAVSQRSLVQAAQSILASWEMPVVPRYLAASPITHAAAMPILPTLLRSGTIFMHKSFSPEAWLRTVQDQRINLGLLVPTMLYAILDSEHMGKFNLSSIETILYGAAPMSPTRLAEAHQKIGNVFVQVYAQSECASIATTLASYEHDPVNKPHLLSSCGKAAVGTTVCLFDDHDNEVPDGVPGEICVRGQNVMTGYWRNPELTAETLKNGWLHTGDMAVRDAEGFLYIVDRKKDMIISGGMNIFPKEIEDVLSQHPAVALASVIGLPDDKWGEAVTAVVVCRPGESVKANELAELVKTAKGPHQAPKIIHFVDSVPMTPVGKVDKKALKEQFKNSQGNQK